MPDESWREMSERIAKERERANRERDRLEEQRREQIRRQDEAARERGETVQPDEIAGAHGPSEVTAEEAKAMGRAFGSDAPPPSTLPDAPAPKTPSTTPTATPTAPPAVGQTTDAAAEARRMDQIGRTQQPGTVPGGLTEEDARQAAIRLRLQEDPIFGGGMQQIDPPSLELTTSPGPEESILDELGPDAEHRASMVGMFSTYPEDVQPPPQPPAAPPRLPLSLGFPPRLEEIRGCLPLLAGSGLTLIGVLMMLWAMSGGRTEYNVVRSEPLATFTLTPRPATPTPAPTTARPVTPVSAGPIVATQSGTTTNYAVEDVKGEGLRYSWRHSATCASHGGEDTATYWWDHPHPPCPNEAFHPSFITVQITDASGQAVVRQYTLGSRPGRGQVPAGGGAFTPQTPSPTTVARTGTPTPTATSTATPASAVVAGTTGGPNVPLAALGLVLTIGGLGVIFGGPRLAGGPLVPAKQAQDDPCAREREREAAARARRDAAAERLRRMDSLSDAAERTRGEAQAARSAASAATQGASSYLNNAGQTVYSNHAQRARIESTETAARSAEAAAADAQRAYDAAGGSAERGAASTEDYRANRDWRDADESLRRCLQLFAPPVAAPTGGGGTAAGGGPGGTSAAGGAPGGTQTGGGTAVGGGGPTVATTTHSGTQTRECPPGAEPRVVSERELRISVADMSTTKLSLDADRTSYIDLDAALDWGRNLRRGLSAGRRGAGRVAPDVGSAMGPMGPLLGVTGTMTDAALNGLEQLGDRLEGHFRGGVYSVTYTRRHFTLRCRVFEECVNGQWTRQPAAFTVEEEAPTEEHEGGHPERDQVIGGHGTNIRGQVDGITRRLFNSLAGRNRRAEADAKAFEGECQ